MKNPVQLTKEINPVRDSPHRSPLRRGLPRVQPIWIIRGFFLITLAFGCFALSRTAQAQLPSPTHDGGYTNGKSAEGDGALFSLSTGYTNQAADFDTCLLKT